MVYLFIHVPVIIYLFNELYIYLFIVYCLWSEIDIGLHVWVSFSQSFQRQRADEKIYVCKISKTVSSKLYHIEKQKVATLRKANQKN